MSIFDFNDPTKSAEENMSNAFASGCIAIVVAMVIFGGIVATIIRVWTR